MRQDPIENTLGFAVIRRYRNEPNSEQLLESFANYADALDYIASTKQPPDTYLEIMKWV
jgi:hypothetical protein